MWMKVPPRAMTVYWFQSFCFTTALRASPVGDRDHQLLASRAEALDDLSVDDSVSDDETIGIRNDNVWKGEKKLR
jgi:hypothetical protein